MRSALAAIVVLWLAAPPVGAATSTGAHRIQRSLHSPLAASNGVDLRLDDGGQEPHPAFKEDGAWEVELGGGKQGPGGSFTFDAVNPTASASFVAPQQGEQNGLERSLESLNDWGPKGFSMAEDRPWCYFTAGPAYCPKPSKLER